MSIFDYLTQLNYNIIRKKIFRKEVETSFFYNKTFHLPKIPPVTSQNLQAFKKNYPFNFYLDAGLSDSVSTALKKVEDEKNIIAEAEKIIKNTFNIFSSGDFYAGSEINWHYDYNAKYKWREVLVWKEDFFKFPEDADIKFPWELARFHMGITLGKAYLLTHDEKYTKKFLELFNSFNENNPFCIGVNWVSPDEAAIRLVNIVFSISLFCRSEMVNEAVLNSLIEFILLHCIFIENNLPYKKYNGHEYLSCLLGLAAAGAVIKNSSYGKKILGFAYSGYEQEIRAQIHNDGTSYEQSIPFHSISLEHFYLAKIILEKSGYKFTADYNEKLKKMFEVQYEYLKEDHSVPQVGDMFSSRIAGFTTNESDNKFSFPIPVGRQLFNDMGFRKIKDTSEVLFLFGEDAIKDYESEETKQDHNNSTAFKDGGHYILRSKDVHLFIEAGEIGKNGEGSPGHNDTFTFELFYKGKSLIVDSGTYSYYADTVLRDFLRSVRAHNTLFIDDVQLSEFEDTFKVKNDFTKPKILEWKTNEHEDILSAQHFAYARLADPVICKRTFNFNKDRNIINIRDEILGGMVHEVFSNIHLHPGVQVTKKDKMVYLVKYGEAECEIIFSVSEESPYFSTSIADAHYSTLYGKIENSKKINVIFKDKLPVFINTEIILR